jgi:hypothetical protein
MNPITWLRERLPHFPTPEQRELLTSIRDFALLWSFFEATVLATWATADRITQRVGEWNDRAPFQIDAFADRLLYFRDRYCPNGAWDDRYDILVRLNEEHRVLVQRVLERRTEDPVECVSAILLIVLRYRNNLFHGPKMNWGFDDQADNFIHANLAVMDAWELERSARAAGLPAMPPPPWLQ